MALSNQEMALIEKLDPNCLGIFVEIPGSKIVIFKSIMDSYEGVCTTRTVNDSNYIMSLFCHPSTLDECIKALESIRDEIPWRIVARPVGATLGL